MTVVSSIAEQVSAAGLRLRKAVPRGRDQLLLDLEDTEGLLIAGQWHRDPHRTAQVAARTRDVCGPSDACILRDTGIVVQRRGADRRLPALHHLASQSGALLVAHRAERRGVVREPGGDYVKVLRPGSARSLVGALGSIDVPGLAVPRVRCVDENLGTVRTTPLPGRTLHDLLADTTCTDDELTARLQTVGAGLRSLHLATPFSTLPHNPPHDAAAELAVTRGWVETATAYGLLTEDAWQPELDNTAELLAGRPDPCVRVHRDLHDKQLLLADGAPVGLLDLDLLTAGEPALDLANLIAHLELRWRQSRCGRDRALACTHALLAGYAAGPSVRRRLPGYLSSTRLRLAAVYAFRDADADLIAGLLDPDHDKELIS